MCPSNSFLSFPGERQKRVQPPTHGRSPLTTSAPDSPALSLTLRTVRARAFARILSEQRAGVGRLSPSFSATLTVDAGASRLGRAAVPTHRRRTPPSEAASLPLQRRIFPHIDAHSQAHELPPEATPLIESRRSSVLISAPLVGGLDASFFRPGARARADPGPRGGNDRPRGRGRVCWPAVGARGCEMRRAAAGGWGGRWPVVWRRGRGGRQAGREATRLSGAQRVGLSPCGVCASVGDVCGRCVGGPCIGLAA